MAEKILNTRILMKVDSLENWSNSTLKLKNGELAFATVAASAGTGLEEPVVMVKIGTAEEKTFSELPWSFYAKASDVLAACKSEAGLTAFVNNVINNAGIATSEALTALTGRVTTAEGEIDTLQSEMDAVEAKAAANETAIGTLNGLVGDTKVADQITTAINNLNLGNTYAAKALETTVSDHVADTVSHVTTADKTKWNGALQASDVAAGSANGTIAVKGTDVAITGLGSAAFTESIAYDAAGAAATAESNAKTYAKEYADGLAGNYDAKGAAAAAQTAAETYAKNYADGLSINYDAAGSASAVEAAAKGYTDSEMTRLVGDKTVGTQISEAITGLDLANTYAAKSHKHVKADITDFAHTHEIADVNGLQDALDGKQAVGDYATKTEAQGYADAKDEAIAAAKKAGDDAQADVDALETYVGTIPETVTATNIVAYVQEKTAGIATNTALEELTGRVATAEGEIDALQGLVGDTKVSDAIDAAVKTEKERAEGIEAGLEGRLAAVEADYLTSTDKEALQTQINTIMSNPDAEGAINSINEFTQYVADHGTIADGFRTDIDKNKEDIAANAKAIADETTRATGVEGGLDTRLKAVEAAVGESGSVAGDIADALAEAKGYTDTEVKELADGAVATNAAAISTLNDLVGDEAVSKQITDVTNPLTERVVALEAVDHEHANKTVLDGIEAADITAWGAKVDDVTAAADSGLKATRTGNTVAIEIDESITWVFDCGTSAE